MEIIKYLKWNAIILYEQMLFFNLDNILRCEIHLIYASFLDPCKVKSFINISFHVYLVKFYQISLMGDSSGTPEYILLNNWRRTNERFFSGRDKISPTVLKTYSFTLRPSFAPRLLSPLICNSRIADDINLRHLVGY